MLLESITAKQNISELNRYEKLGKKFSFCNWQIICNVDLKPIQASKFDPMLPQARYIFRKKNNKYQKTDMCSSKMLKNEMLRHNLSSVFSNLERKLKNCQFKSFDF